MSKKRRTKLWVFENKDKTFHEKWDDDYKDHRRKEILAIPHPWRACLFGPPNCGKTNTVFNLLHDSMPRFEEMIVIHCSPQHTKEYDDCHCIMLDQIPDHNDWIGEVKTLVVLDDINFKGLSKKAKHDLNRLYGNASTHKNISVILCAQDAFNVPAIVRRCCNVWVIWRVMDLDSMATIARRTGFKKADFRYLYDKYINTNHDSIWIDCTTNTPFPLRKNGLIPLHKAVKRDYKELVKINDGVDESDDDV